MLLNNFEIEENPHGESDIKISAEVIIKRDEKHYAVKIRKEYKYRDGSHLVQVLREFKDLIMQFYMECRRIEEFHIPVPEGQFINEHQKEIYDEVFILN